MLTEDLNETIGDSIGSIIRLF